MQPAGKQEVLELRAGLLDPRLQDVPRCLCDLELDRTLRLVLHDDGARRHLVIMKSSLRALFIEIQHSRFSDAVLGDTHCRQ